MGAGLSPTTGHQDLPGPVTPQDPAPDAGMLGVRASRCESCTEPLTGSEVKVWEVLSLVGTRPDWSRHLLTVSSCTSPLCVLTHACPVSPLTPASLSGYVAPCDLS